MINMDDMNTDNTFKIKMINAYRATVNHMPDNGIEILMFNHTSINTWMDMLEIIQGAGLYITAVWPVVAETGKTGSMSKTKGNYDCAMIIVCRKRLFEYELITEEEAFNLLNEMEADDAYQMSMMGVDLYEVDKKIYNWLKGIKVLSAFQFDFDLKEFLFKIK